MRFREQLFGTTMLWAPDPPPASTPPVTPPPVEPPPPVAVAPPAADPPVTPPVDPPTPEPKRDWRDDRIAELTAKLNAAKRAVPTAPTVTPPPPVTPQAPGESEAEFDSRVNARAAEMAAITDWNKQCDAVAAAGKSEFKDFDSRLADIHKTINSQDPDERQQYNDVLAAAIEAGEGSAHKLLYSLGETPGEFKRLMSLPPLKRAVEMTKLATKLAASSAEPEPSGAPKPLTPIGSNGVHYEGITPDDPNRGMKLPIGEWMKQREAQARERNLQ